MEKLPNVFANPINHSINNVQELYYESNRSTPSSIDINKKINQIFSSINHVYKSKVKITYKDSISEETIVGKTSLNLLTMEGKLIKITDIIDIERI